MKFTFVLVSITETETRNGTWSQVQLPSLVMTNDATSVQKGSSGASGINQFSHPDDHVSVFRARLAQLAAPGM